MGQFRPWNQIVLWSLFFITALLLCWTLRWAQRWFSIFSFIIPNYSHKSTPLYLIFNVLNNNSGYFWKFLTNSITAVLMRVSFHDDIKPGFKNKRFNSSGLANSSDILKPPHLIAKLSLHQNLPIFKALEWIMTNSLNSNVTWIERIITNEGDYEK